MSAGRFIFPVIAILSLHSPVGAETLQIVDGDTLKLGSISYRLNGIDAPEYGQKCSRSGGGTWPCGKDAVAQLEALTADREVTCTTLSEDGYSRSIADCYAADVKLGEAMVRTGYAWAFVRYSKAYVEQEQRARSEGLGIWQGESQPAWEYRADKWAVGDQQAPEGCPIKGNISKHGRIYHAPWSPWYSQTKISVEKGERWFCDEAEAIAAGW